MPDVSLLLTCEHAVNAVPERWQHLFQGNFETLEGHRGWDLGAAELAQNLARELSAPCFMARVSRLLLDHNRSPHNRSLWSEFSRELTVQEKTLMLDEYYRPFREQTSRWIAERQINGGRVIHVSVHSFTPVLDGKVRDVDIGLLYDTNRSDEAFLADIWKSRLTAGNPELKVRFNVPYRGRSDCHQRSYRELYKSGAYQGIELEINQNLVSAQSGYNDLKRLLADSLREAMVEMTSDE